MRTSISKGLLSFVIHFCLGTSKKFSLRSTFIARSIMGIMYSSPGPFAPGSARPRRNITALSYSRYTRSPLIKISKVSIITIMIEIEIGSSNGEIPNCSGFIGIFFLSLVLNVLCLVLYNYSLGF